MTVLRDCAHTSGRALKSAENFKILYDLADAVGNCAGVLVHASVRASGRGMLNSVRG
jgi:hypothetical protein